MAPTEAEIKSLLSGDFTPEVVSKFEEYVTAQVAGQVAYHADAVRRLVKLYQLYPTTCKAEILAQACFLALLQFPNHTDFLALKYMIPVNTLNQDDTCDLIKTCFQQLESCQFTQFWESYANLESSSSLKSYLTADKVKAFQGAILQVMSLTYKEVPASIVLPAVKLESTDAIKALGHPLVESVSMDAVVFVATNENTKRQRVYQASLDFDSISALMSKIAQ